VTHVRLFALVSTLTGLAAGSAASKPVARTASAGCTLRVPQQSGERQIRVQGEIGRYIISFPPGYDGTRPYPLGFAFHGYNRTHQDCQATDCAGFQKELGDRAILVYMKSIGAGWTETGRDEQNTEFFGAVLEELKGSACVDERRIFVAGTSSGARFANLVGCRYGDQLQAVAPVAGQQIGFRCNGHPAALVIHGVDDSHIRFSLGEELRDSYASRNGCSTHTLPEIAAVHARIRQARNAHRTDQACADYQGCKAAPVRWCEHSEGGYDDTTHGWPTAGGALIRDFLDQSAGGL
jgi:polyhydroxybutyrate depolymerase